MPYRTTPRAAALLALAAAACVLAPLVGLVLAAGALVAISGDAWVAGTRVPTVRRHLPRALVRGVPRPFELQVEGWGARVRQPGTAELVVDHDDDGLTVVARRRGWHVLPAPRAEVIGPLGLGTWTGSVGDAVEMEVHPDVRVARPYVRSARTTRFDIDSGRGRGPLGLGTAFESLRDYTTGDDVRRVNWKATARAGRPIVNEFRMESSRDVVLLVDAGRVHHGPAGAEVYEAIVGAAAALALTVDAVGDRCGTLVFADHPLTQLVPRSGGGRPAIAAINAVEPRPVDSDYEVAFRSLALKRAVVVVFTDLVDDLASASLVAAVPVLARRHQVIVVGADPMRPVTVATDGANGVLAASLLQEERARAVQLLRRSGTTVTSAPPDRLAAAACLAYLDVKARARA